MDPQTDTDELRLDLLTASAGAWQVGLIMRIKGLQPDPHVDLTPNHALQPGEWLIARDKERRAAHRTIEGSKTGF